MGSKRILVAGKSREEVFAKVSAQGAVVGLQLSEGIYVVTVPETYEDSSTQLDPPQTVEEVIKHVPSITELWLDGLSDLETNAWEAFKEREVIKVERAVPFTKRGKVAIAVLMILGKAEHHKLTDKQIYHKVLPSLWHGAESLEFSYPDHKLDIKFKPYYITLSASSQVPHVGLTSWPSAVPFQNKLYVFYQGNRFSQKRVRYNVFDPAKGVWEGITEVPSTTITDGPSVVVYNNHLYLFHSGNASRHEVWYNVFDGTNWAGDARIDKTRITGGPSTVVYDGKIYCFHQGYTEANNELWYNVYDGTKWVGDKLVVGTQITESPSAVVFKDKIYCFYKGLGDMESTLLLNRFDPKAEEWSGHVAVPYTKSTTKGPSAVVFGDKIYLFHQSGSHGELWFNTSIDGSLWRGDTPLTHEMSTEGLGTTVFGDELHCFFQGVDKNFEALMHRSFAKGSLEWEDVWSLPALKSLGYETYAQLAEAVRVQLKADYGYVTCVTKLPLLYDAYADETRLCMQYPANDIATTFAQIFDATGVHDVSTDPTMTDPRYTFALTSAVSNTVPVPITLYATGFVFHQGLGTDSGKRLWFSFLDRRSGNWTEMQGPVTSKTTEGHAGVFFSYEKLYVFYQVQQNGGELYYNVLDGILWTGEQKVPNIQGATGSPGAVFYKNDIHCFYQGANKNGQLWHNVLDARTDTWRGEIRLALQEDEFEGNKIIFHTYVTHGPSPAVFRNYVYNLYNGAVLTPADSGVTRYGRLRVNVFNGSGAISDMQVPHTYLTAEPSAVVYNDKLHAFHQGSNDDGTVWVNTTTGEKEDFWDGDKRFPLPKGFLVQDGPSAMALEGKLYCFLRGKGNNRNDKLWYNVLEGSDSEWGVQKILPTASGIGGQHDALAIGSLSIQYDATPPIVERVI